MLRHRRPSVATAPIALVTAAHLCSSVRHVCHALPRTACVRRSRDIARRGEAIVVSALAIALTYSMESVLALPDANTDVMTGVESRYGFLQRLRRRGGSIWRPSGAASIVYLDLDGFKDVNDRFGHASGDAVLVEVARRLRAGVGSHGVVARLGGDEFAVLLESVGAADVASAVALVRRAFAEPFDAAGGPLSASIGCVRIESGESPDALLHRADLAMYAAKRAR